LAVSVCVSVCSRYISSKTAEQIWLKFCSGTEVCPGHVSHILLTIARDMRNGFFISVCFLKNSDLVWNEFGWVRLVKRGSVRILWLFTTHVIVE